MTGTTVTPQALYLTVKNLVQSTLNAELKATNSLVDGYETAYDYMVHLLGDGLLEMEEDEQRKLVGGYFHDLNLHRAEYWTIMVQEAMVEVASMKNSPVLKEVQALLAVEDKASLDWVNKAKNAVEVKLYALSLYAQLNSLLSRSGETCETIENAQKVLRHFADNSAWIERAEGAIRALEAYLVASRLVREVTEMKRKLQEVLCSFKRNDDRPSVVRARELVSAVAVTDEWLTEATEIYVKIYSLKVGDYVGEEVLPHWFKILPDSVPYEPLDKLFEAFEAWEPTMEWARNAEELLKELRKADEPTCPCCQKNKLQKANGGQGNYPEKCSSCDLPEVVETLPMATADDLKALEAAFNSTPKKSKRDGKKNKKKK